MKTKPSISDLEHNRNAVNGAISKVAAQLAAKATQPTDQELIIEKANVVIKDVRETFLRMYNLRVVPMRFPDAVAIINNMYKEHYKTWTKDELLTFCSLKDAVLAAQSLQDELI